MKLCAKRKYVERISNITNVDVIKMQNSGVGYVIQFLVLVVDIKNYNLQ
jgi:hypothetical protein